MGATVGAGVGAGDAAEDSGTVRRDAGGRFLKGTAAGPGRPGGKDAPISTAELQKLARPISGADLLAIAMNATELEETLTLIRTDGRNSHTAVQLVELAITNQRLAAAAMHRRLTAELSS